MQKTDPFCKHIFKCLLNRKAPQHETDIFTHVKGLLYKHVMDSGQKFIALVIPKSWKYTVLVEAHAKLGHQGMMSMMEILDRPFDKITIDLVMECRTSTSGNKHIATIIDHLTGWPEAFPIPDKTANTIVSTFINEY